MDVQHTSSRRPIRQAARRHNYALLNSKGLGSEISGSASDSSASYQTAAMCQETLTDNDREKIGGDKAPPLYSTTQANGVHNSREFSKAAKRLLQLHHRT
jgi:hypothetical protein